MNVQASDLPPSAAILVSWIFSLPQASLNHNIADGEAVVKSRTYQDALWAWARATFVGYNGFGENKLI